MKQGENELLLKLVQPDGQRARAYVAFGETPASDNTRPCLRWFADPSVPRPSLPAPAGRRALWFRFLAAPGLRGFEVAARGELQAWADGQPMTVESMGEHDGIRRHVATAARPCDGPVVVALRVAAPREFRAGDALPEPVKMHCGTGHLPAGDWCQHGLATYSGIGEYRRTIDWPALHRTARVILDAGEIRATAEILVNGQSAGTLVAPPWRLDLTPWLKEGKNELVIRVANTLANHYSVGIPSPYAFPEQTPSGLLGPVRLVIENHTITPVMKLFPRHVFLALAGLLPLATLPAPARAATPEAMENFRALKHGFFVHYVWPGGGGLTIKPDGTHAASIDELADAFDVPGFVNDLVSWEVEYLIFTAWHANINPLFPSKTMEKWGLPGQMPRNATCCARSSTPARPRAFPSCSTPIRATAMTCAATTA